jgi:DNA-binding NarL/FixJ family response regulator
MNPKKQSQKASIHVVVIDSDPLRLLGFHALLEPEPDFEFSYASMSDLDRHGHIDIILLGNQRGLDSFDDLVKLKTLCPDAQIIVMVPAYTTRRFLQPLPMALKGIWMRALLRQSSSAPSVQ